MDWTARDIPDQTGRVAVVTGANGGLGLEVTRALAGKGAHVVMASRDRPKAERAHEDIVAGFPAASLEIRALDLGSLDSVRGAAADILASHERLDLLINNAGVMGLPELRTADGFEMQFGVNHLGHFALTALLFPALRESAGARVVSVTSTGRHLSRRVDPDDPHLNGRYEPWRAYGRSKLANVHFALELERRARAANVRLQSLIAHPGFVHTDLQARSVRETRGGASQRFFHEAVQRFGMPPVAGALSILRAATDPSARGGELYTPRYVNRGPPVRRPLLGRSQDRAALRTLWEVSERETGVTFALTQVDT